MLLSKSFNPEKYFGFDDRKFMLVGVFLISFVLFPVFSGIDFMEYYRHAKVELIHGILLTFAFWKLYRYIFIKMRQRLPNVEDTPKRIKKLLIILFVSAPIVGNLLSAIIHGVYGLMGYEDCIHMGFIREIIVTWFLSFSVLATYEAIYYFVKYRDTIQLTEQLKTAQVQSELDNLRNQINPHFLFNSLNTLMNLIPKDQERAMSYLSKLSKFYRYSVGQHEASLVALHEEIKNAELYAELLKERFRDSISVEIDIIKSQKKVVPLSLQLLIENAVKHNIVSKNKPLHIKVSMDKNEEYVCITNNLQRKIQEVNSTGIGLENISRRFEFFTEKKVQVNDQDGQFNVSLPLIEN